MKTHVNFTRIQILLYYFARFIGLAPFSVENNILRPVGRLRKVYAMILAILSSLWVSYAFLIYRSGVEITFSNRFVFTMVLVLLTGNVCVSLWVFAFKSNEMIDIVNQILTIKDDLKKLRIEENFGKNCKTVYARIIATNIVVLLMRIIVNSADSDEHRSHGTTFVILFWIGSITTTVHVCNANLIFIETMICIGKLFESLNNKLQSTVQSDVNFFSFDEPRNSSVLRMGRNRMLADQVAHRIPTAASENVQLSVEDVEMIRKLHRELCELVKSTTDFYTVPILVTIVRDFSFLLLSCYSIYKYLFMSDDAFKTVELTLGIFQRYVSRFVTLILELLLIGHACTSISKAGNATKAMLHEVWNKFYPEELRNTLLKFSLQLLQEPVTVSAFEFFLLDYSCLYKMFCAVVAYLIIMIQFDKSQPNPGS